MISTKRAKNLGISTNGRDRGLFERTDGIPTDNIYRGDFISLGEFGSSPAILGFLLQILVYFFESWTARFLGSAVFATFRIGNNIVWRKVMIATVRRFSVKVPNERKII